MTNLFKSVLSLLFFIIVQMNISQAQNIVGKWVLYDMKFSLNEKATPEQKKDYETNKDMLGIFLQMMKGKMTLEFTFDGVCISNTPGTDGKDEIERGKWRIEGSKLFMQDEGKPEEETQYEIVEGKLNIMSNEQGMDSKLTLLKQ